MTGSLPQGVQSCYNVACKSIPAYLAGPDQGGENAISSRAKHAIRKRAQSCTAASSDSRTCVAQSLYIGCRSTACCSLTLSIAATASFERSNCLCSSASQHAFITAREWPNIAAASMDKPLLAGQASMAQETPDSEAKHWDRAGIHPAATALPSRAPPQG